MKNILINSVVIIAETMTIETDNGRVWYKFSLNKQVIDTHAHNREYRTHTPIHKYLIDNRNQLFQLITAARTTEIEMTLLPVIQSAISRQGQRDNASHNDGLYYFLLLLFIVTMTLSRLFCAG